MNRQVRYILSLAGFFLMWGVFGFAAGAPRPEPGLQATALPAESTPVVPLSTESTGIPVTGDTEPVLTEIIVFYGLIGFTALFLVLALLNLANKTSAFYAQKKPSTPNEPNKE